MHYSKVQRTFYALGESINPEFKNFVLTADHADSVKRFVIETTPGRSDLSPHSEGCDILTGTSISQKLAHVVHSQQNCVSLWLELKRDSSW